MAIPPFPENFYRGARRRRDHVCFVAELNEGNQIVVPAVHAQLHEMFGRGEIASITVSPIWSRQMESST